MRVDGNQGSKIHYEPNSFGQWQDQPEYADPAQKASGDIMRYDFRVDDADYYTQPGKLFRLMNKNQQQILFDNTARNMDGVPEFIKMRHIENCLKADPAYGKGVAKAMGINLEESDEY